MKLWFRLRDVFGFDRAEESRMGEDRSMSIEEEFLHEGEYDADDNALFAEDF